MKPNVRDQVTEALRAGPVTKSELVDKFGLNRLSVNTVLSRMRQRGDAHIGAWRSGLGPPIAVFVLGTGTDAQRPEPKEARPPRRKRKAMTAGGYTRAAIVALLREHRHSTIPELIAETGFDRRAVYAEVKALRDGGKAYIAEYLEPKGPGARLAVIALGRGTDAVKVPISHREAARRYRERHAAIIRARHLAASGATPRVPVWLQGLAP